VQVTAVFFKSWKVKLSLAAFHCSFDMVTNNNTAALVHVNDVRSCQMNEQQLPGMMSVDLRQM
jgi:hypothetical protein